jgi:hypothetical protein
MVGDWLYFPAILWRTQTLMDLKFSGEFHTAMDLDVLIRLLAKATGSSLRQANNVENVLLLASVMYLEKYIILHFQIYFSEYCTTQSMTRFELNTRDILYSC